MRPDTICKTVHQYNKEPIADRDMEKLQEIAEDCRKVKNYVYARFGGIGSLSKLYPGYTIQNEMTASGLREELSLPSVYFYLAAFDAIGDIKGQWTRTKNRVLQLVGDNGSFTEEEKHYLHFLLKVNNAFDAVLNQRKAELPKEIQKQYDELAGRVDTERLNRYLCRQVRKHHARQGKLHADAADGFSIAERAYRYADHGIYLSIKEKRKRIFVPLTDNNQYKSQLYIKLYPQEARIELNAPVEVAVRRHGDYCNRIGVSLGLYTMLTTDEGHRYGEELGKHQTEYADWIRKQTGSYNRNRADNPGRKKYAARKRRLEEQMHSYINHELNRFIRTEKPLCIYIAKLPKPQANGCNKKINHSMTMWKRGYIRSRLIQKCREQTVEVTEVLGKGISRECSCCGAVGNKEGFLFVCPACGYSVEEKTNTARNALNRGMKGQTIR
jgi:putative transposase|nr:zinc ribbon domain-containing protein [uncultured Acetatifactor sp.]